MLEYQIPFARFASVLVMGACFVIALILMNTQAAGRSRTFGVLGLSMVLASTFLQAANVSVASVYGKDTVVYETGLIVVAVFAAAGLVLLAFAVVRARQSRRTRGAY